MAISTTRTSTKGERSKGQSRTKKAPPKEQRRGNDNGEDDSDDQGDDDDDDDDDPSDDDNNGSPNQERRRIVAIREVFVTFTRDMFLTPFEFPGEMFTPPQFRPVTQDVVTACDAVIAAGLGPMNAILRNTQRLAVSMRAVLNFSSQKDLILSDLRANLEDTLAGSNVTTTVDKLTRWRRMLDHYVREYRQLGFLTVDHCRVLFSTMIALLQSLVQWDYDLSAQGPHFWAGERWQGRVYQVWRRRGEPNNFFDSLGALRGAIPAPSQPDLASIQWIGQALYGKVASETTGDTHTPGVPVIYAPFCNALPEMQTGNQ